MNHKLFISFISIALFQNGPANAETMHPAGKPVKLSISPNLTDIRPKDDGPALAARAIAINLSVKQWPGKRFIILSKQKIVQAFGYELYLTPELARSKNKPNPDLETKERRIRCDKFAESIIIAREVKPSGKDYLVHFIHEPTKISLFGKTNDGALEGLALFDDFYQAQRRWMGKTIYATRRFINRYDSITGNVKTQKVTISDPLRVFEIRWGTTPLPRQPLWLMVETLQGLRGFLPVCISWTNILFGKITHGAPWEEDIMEQDPKKLFSWDDVVWEAINSHSILSKMTKMQVRLSWGLPKTIRKDTVGTAKSELWLFDNEQELHFIGDTLVSISGQ
jgi:hypothetical protein